MEVDMRLHREPPDDGQQQRMLRETTPPDFLDSSVEWRRIFSEVWGTFLLVVVAAGADVMAAKSGGAVTLGMAVVAPGLMVMVIIYFMGTVSGAHLNPAVTFAFAVRRNFPWRRVPGYLLGQIAGGIAAAIFLRTMFGTAGELGATEPGAGVSALQALVMEALLTAGLVNTVLGTASGARNIGTNGALAVGSYIALAGLWAAPISGASMKPVRLPRSRSGPRGLWCGVGLSHRPVCWGDDRSRIRVGSEGSTHHYGDDRGARHAGER
jgi:aquaporin Z